MVYLVKPPYPSHVKYAVNAHYEYREQRGRKLLRLGDLHGLALVIHGYTLSYIFTFAYMFAFVCAIWNYSDSP